MRTSESVQSVVVVCRSIDLGDPSQKPSQIRSAKCDKTKSKEGEREREKAVVSSA